MKATRDIVILLLILSSGIIWAMFLSSRSEQALKIGAVDIETIYTEFEMTKELDKKYKLKTSELSVQIDSLNNLLKTEFRISKNKNLQASIEAEIEDRVKILKQIQLEFEDQIWSRIEQYLTEFGDENNIDLIIRKGFESNIFYSNQELEITSDVAKHINNKYLGNETH